MGGRMRSVYSPHRPGEIGNNGYAKLGGYTRCIMVYAKKVISWLKMCPYVES